MLDEKRIRLTARLYEMRDTARNLLGADYPEKLKPYRTAVALVARENGGNEFAAAIDIVKKAEADGTDSDRLAGLTLYLIAAAVEEAEAKA